jgi:hypothetical protein
MKNLNATTATVVPVVTDDVNLLEFATQHWRNNGKPAHMDNQASNSRMSEIDCAQMLVKTGHIDAWQAAQGQI